MQKKNYDEKCKSILSFKNILSYLLKSVIKEYEDLTIEEIEGLIEASEGKKVIGIRNEYDPNIMDLVFRIKVPSEDSYVDVYVNVEGQRDKSLDYPIIKRAFWYCMQMVQKQYGTEFNKMDYGKIKKVISIWIIFGTRKSKEGNMISFSIEPTQMIGNNIVEKDYDLMQIIEIYLSKEKNEYGIMEVLRELLLSEDPIEKKKEILSEYGLEMDSELENEVTEMEGFGQYIEDRGFEKGMLKGKELGIAEGKAQGLTEGRINTIIEFMKSLGISKEEVIKKLNLTDEEISELDKVLNQ